MPLPCLFLLLDLLVSQVSAKIILPLAFGEGAVMYGVGGAMVVAAHAMGAMPLPFGTALRHADVVQRAFPLTTSASRALRIGAEAAVCDDKTIKDRLHHIGLQPGEFAPQRFKTSLFASAYQLGDTRQFRLGFGYLSFFIFRSARKKTRWQEPNSRNTARTTLSYSITATDLRTYMRSNLRSRCI